MKKFLIRWKFSCIALLLAAASLAACGTKAQEGDTNSERIIIYMGNPLHCVIDGLGDYRTMSCDWVRYHKENG